MIGTLSQQPPGNLAGRNGRTRGDVRRPAQGAFVPGERKGRACGNVAVRLGAADDEASRGRDRVHCVRRGIPVPPHVVAAIAVNRDGGVSDRTERCVDARDGDRCAGRRSYGAGRCGHRRMACWSGDLVLRDQPAQDEACDDDEREDADNSKDVEDVAYT